MIFYFLFFIFYFSIFLFSNNYPLREHGKRLDGVEFLYLFYYLWITDFYSFCFEILFHLRLFFYSTSPCSLLLLDLKVLFTPQFVLADTRPPPAFFVGWPTKHGLSLPRRNQQIVL